MLKTLLTPLRWLARVLLALLILFEEWGWAPLSRAMARLGQLPLLRRLGPLIRGLPPYAALCLLLLPSLLIIPVKLLALWLVLQGRTLLGLAVVLLAKLAGTALLARLFELIQPALMRLGWFERLYRRWIGWKQGLMDWLHQQALWRSARLLKRRLRRIWARH